MQYRLMGCGIHPYRGKIVHLKGQSFEAEPGDDVSELALKALYGRADKGVSFYGDRVFVIDPDGKVLTVDVPG